MLLRLLGPVEVGDGNAATEIAALKLRSLLAALALRRGRTAAADELIDALWPESAPASAAKLLQVYVSQLRRLLPPGVAIATRASGYALEVDPGEVDLDVFERLADDGRAALAAGNPSLAASLLRRALGLWRGPAFADLQGDERGVAEARRLEAIRELVVLDRLEAELQLGRHEMVLAEVRSRLASDWTDERLAGLAMRASHAVEGPVEALRIFEVVRAAVREELGEEPGPGLAALRDRIAGRDPSLNVSVGPATAGDATPRLPVPPNPLIGRDADLAALESILERPSVRLVSLTGAGGSGKSRLALEVAHARATEYANGAVLVELGSVADSELVLPTIASALGLDPGPDALATLQSALASREILLLVDNVEHLRAVGPDLVRLLAVAPRLVILATSRVVLHLSGEHVYPVGPLAQDDAVELFVQRARDRDPAFAVDDATRPIVASICARLDGLPLPIELAATRVRSLGLQALDERLASRLTVLTGGPRDLPARQQTLRETLAWSVNLLQPREAAVLAALAVFAGSFPLDGARAVATADDDVMAELVDHHLVQILEVDGERRFRLLQTIREYAYELLGSRRESVERGLVEWIVGILSAAELDGQGDPQLERLRRIDAVLDSMRDALQHAARDPDPSNELAIAAVVWRYWLIRGHLAEGRAVLDGILARRGLVDSTTGIRTARGAASLAWNLGDVEAASALGRSVLAAAVRLGDPYELAHAHNLAGVLAQLDIAACERHHFEAIRLAEAIGEEDVANRSRANLAGAYLDTGQLEDARRLFQRVLDSWKANGLSEGLGLAHLNLGELEFKAGDFSMAEYHFLEAARSFRAIGFGARLANAYQGLAAVEARTGRAESAARRLGTAASLLGEIGWGGDGTSLGPSAIDAAREVLGDETFERLFSEGTSAASESAP